MSRHRCHGDPARFEVVAEFIAERFPHARYVADVGGGQGMLTRLLRKRLGLDAEVIDPRGWTLKGVPARVENFDASMAEYYDLVVGLHPDEALRSVVESAAKSAVLVIPCCNFWSHESRLGRDQLIEQISRFHNQRGGKSERVVLDFRGPEESCPDSPAIVRLRSGASVVYMRADSRAGAEAEGAVPDEDKKRAAHRALVDRVLSAA